MALKVTSVINTASGAKPLTVDDMIANAAAAGRIPHMAHRGNGFIDLDSSLEGYEAAFQSGHDFFDGGDLWLNGEGQLLDNHNNPTTGELLTANGMQYSGDITKFSVAAFKAAKHRVASENPVYANLPDRQTATFDDVCSLVKRYGGVVITPEMKTTGAATAAKAVQTIQKHGIEKSVILNAFTLADLALAKAAGIKTCWLASTFSDTTTVSSAVSAGVDFFGYDYTASATFTPARLQSMYDAGIRLAPWTLTRRSDATAEAARVGRPLAWVASWYGTFTGGVIPPANADPFPGMTPFRGQIPSGGNRGVFTRQNKLSIINGAAVHQGWGSRDTAWSKLRVVITYETIGASTTAGAYVLFGLPDDRLATFSSAPQGGYILKPQPNGTVTWQKWNGTSFTTLGSFTLAAGAYAAGGFNTFDLEMQAAATKITCVETGQTSNAAAETQYRGGHFVFGNSASDCEVSFSGCVVTP